MCEIFAFCENRIYLLSYGGIYFIAKLKRKIKTFKNNTKQNG